MAEIDRAAVLAGSLRAMAGSVQTHRDAWRPHHYKEPLSFVRAGDLSDAADLIEKLAATLNGMLESAAGRRVLGNLADGIGTNTEDGRVWIGAAKICGKAGWVAT